MSADPVGFRPAPRLAVICVDGATPGFTRALGLFKAADGAPAAAIRSVYPSSTAPAHASMLTGTLPAAHGIVANRFWEGETADVIRTRQAPLAALHPYERSSLRSRSFVDEVLDSGLRVAAIHFPHTFARHVRHPLLESVYCLYAPAQTWQIACAGAPECASSGAETRSFTAELFGEAVQISVCRLAPDRRDRPVLRLSANESEQYASAGQPADMRVEVDSGRVITFDLSVDMVADTTATVTQGIAVLVLAAGTRPSREWASGSVCPQPRFAGPPDQCSEFRESPSVDWITARGLDEIADEPDVLLVRYSQVDHTHERLYWQATRGDTEEREAAQQEIRDVYRRVADGVRDLIDAVGPDCTVIVLSDHGIDYVDEKIAPNVLLEKLGLASEFIFQGDSNICYLYGARPLTEREGDALQEGLAAEGAGRVRVLSRPELRARQILHETRCGRLALESRLHAEFEYGSRDGTLCCPAQSASHGFDPEVPSMDGIWQVMQGGPLPRPASLTDVAGVLRHAAFGTSGYG
jgi:hypothetical protein